MRLSRWPSSALLALLVVAAPLAGVAQQPQLSDVLDRAAAYVAVYEEQASTLLFDEHYIQRVTSVAASPPPGRPRPDSGVPASLERRLRSEVAMVRTGDLGWVMFRDVLEVDGRPRPGREDRLRTLFARPLSEASLQRARTVADESARFNVGSVQRDVNYPTMALMYLRQEQQQRSSFVREGSARVGGVATWVVKFVENARPTLIGTRVGEARVGDVRTSGRFYIEPDRGLVRRSQITVEEAFATGTFDVTYGPAPGVDGLVPASMEENVSVRAGDRQLERGLATAGDIRPVEMIRGEARYSNVRRFRATAAIKDATIVIP